MNSSPDKYNKYNSSIEMYTKQLNDAEDKDQSAVQEMIDWYTQLKQSEINKLDDPEWQKNNLEYDLRTSSLIIEKCKDNVYAQNLYAAMCNRDFIKNEVWDILREGPKWSCSWRHAGGIIADILQEGDYMDWYCSGIRPAEELTDIEFNMLNHDQQISYKESLAYVSEGIVTDEIKQDLLTLGWVVLKE